MRSISESLNLSVLFIIRVGSSPNESDRIMNEADPTLRILTHRTDCRAWLGLDSVYDLIH
jgi:hypothetical protein